MDCWPTTQLNCWADTRCCSDGLKLFFQPPDKRWRHFNMHVHRIYGDHPYSSHTGVSCGSSMGVWEWGSHQPRGLISQESVVKKILEDVEISQVQDHSAPWIPFFSLHHYSDPLGVANPGTNRRSGSSGFVKKTCVRANFSQALSQMGVS